MKTLFLGLLAAAGVAASESTLFAQRAMYNPDPRIVGNTYRPYSARIYSRHAVNHAQVLRYYGSNHPEISQDTAKEHVAEIRRNIDAFGKEAEKMAALYQSDPEAMKLIAEIREHQKEAAAHCTMAEKECIKHLADGGAVARCCTDMLKHLKAADEAHEQLLKHLKVPLPADGAKK